MQVTIERRALDPWILYLYAMRSPAATKEKYLMKFERFLNFLNLLGGILKDESIAFTDRGGNYNAGVFNSILKIIQLLK